MALALVSLLPVGLLPVGSTPRWLTHRSACPPSACSLVGLFPRRPAAWPACCLAGLLPGRPTPWLAYFPVGLPRRPTPLAGAGGRGRLLVAVGLPGDRVVRAEDQRDLVALRTGGPAG